MRLDHIAYRVADRDKTAAFLNQCFGYRVAEDLPDGFKIEFEDGTNARCLVLLPPEKLGEANPWSHLHCDGGATIDDHMAPEIFVSQGIPGSVVEKWVQARGASEAFTIWLIRWNPWRPKYRSGKTRGMLSLRHLSL